MHHHVKKGQWDEPYLRCTLGGHKVRAVVHVIPRDEILVVPEGCKELTHIWYRAVSFQGPDEAAAVYRVVGLP